jgi:hypothetical protein
MRKTLIALVAATGLVGLGAIGASAAPVPPARAPAQISNIQPADWYCGPRCDWRHHRWEERNGRREHHPYYGYNRGYHGYNGYYYR